MLVLKRVEALLRLENRAQPVTCILDAHCLHGALQDSTPVARRFFNTLAEEPETVAAALVPRIRGVQGTRSSIDFLNPVSAVLRVIGGVPQIIGGGRFFDKAGDRVVQDGQRYEDSGVRQLYEQ